MRINCFRTLSSVNCEWNEWVHGECSKTCGGGTRKNFRSKRITEDLGGTCLGERTLTDECNTQGCPGSIY